MPRKALLKLFNENLKFRNYLMKIHEHNNRQQAVSPSLLAGTRVFQCKYISLFGSTASLLSPLFLAENFRETFQGFASVNWSSSAHGRQNGTLIHTTFFMSTSYNSKKILQHFLSQKYFWSTYRMNALSSSKFSFSEKTTKICAIFLMLLRFTK